MVAECNQAYVPLKNELNMIANYIELEKIRYGNRLSMQIELMQPEGNHFIAPLLMIPFVENSFKHGVSQILEHPRIILKIYVERNVLYFFLNNSKPSFSPNQDLRKGIGLENVKKRLDLLYPNKHKLLILHTEETFTVEMEISLSSYIMLETETDIFSTMENNRNIAYAIQS
jgi:LytS/YehU family sensor histidine kinase